MEEQGLHRMLCCQRRDLADGDEMIAGFMDGLEPAIDPCEAAVEYRQAQIRCSMRDADELIDGRCREPSGILSSWSS